MGRLSEAESRHINKEMQVDVSEEIVTGDIAESKARIEEIQIRIPTRRACRAGRYQRQEY
jgi:hypothetical protein